jgi:hypothetical protein
MTRSDKPPEPELIRHALATMITVAACHKKSIDDPSRDTSDAHASRLLHDLVAATDRFAQSVQARKQRALADTLTSELAEIYRAVRSGAISSDGATHLIWQLFREKMFPLTASQFAVLMLSDEEIRRHPESGTRGAMDAARTTVAKILGVSRNTIANWGKTAGSYYLPTQAFGIGLGRSGLLRYALSLFAPEGPDVERAQAILERATSDPEEDADPE